MMDSSRDFVVIGEVVKPRGLRGEVVVKSWTDVEGRFAGLERVFLHDGSGRRVALAVEAVRADRSMFLVKFGGIRDRLAARAQLVGRTLEIPRAESPPAGEGENYYYELIGLEVYCEDGARLGVLETIIETGANDVYLVRADDGHQVLLPGTREVVTEVDVNAGRMTIHPIAGLLDEQAAAEEDGTPAPGAPPRR